jgi:hypothetical protein
MLKRALAKRAMPQLKILRRFTDPIKDPAKAAGILSASGLPAGVTSMSEEQLASLDVSKLVAIPDQVDRFLKNVMQALGRR